MHGEIKGLESALKSEETKNQELRSSQSQVDAMDSRLNDLEEDYEKVTEELLEAKTKAKLALAAKEGEIQELQDRLKENESQCDENRKTLATERKLRELVDSKDNRIKDLEEALMAKSGRDDNIEELKETLASQKSALDAKDNTIEQLRCDIETLSETALKASQEALTAEKAMGGGNKSMSEAEGWAAALQSDLEVVSVRASDLERQLSEAQIAIIQARGEAIAAEGRVAVMRDEISCLKKRLSHYEKPLPSPPATIKDIKEVPRVSHIIGDPQPHLVGRSTSVIQYGAHSYASKDDPEEDKAPNAAKLAAMQGRLIASQAISQAVSQATNSALQ